MGTKSITITDEAYNHLKNIKGNGSFSDVILSLTKRSTNIMKYAGALKHADLKSIKNMREEINRDWKNRN